MDNVVTTNKKAYRDFELFDKYQCGIVLQGAEIKSVRAGKVNFKSAFARIDEDELFLFNLSIDPYVQASYLATLSERPRKLLVHKREVKKIYAVMSQKNMTLVPTQLYFNNRGILKVEIALAKGKRSFDKRDDIKKRSIDREIDRRMKK
ncbi:MAG: SsrA-binding protein SmpB [Candidatus Omnitrophica bacterium]|nr:SsrA-binding protein SmpB [Candidatus Omnitrophota bacterium]